MTPYYMTIAHLTTANPLHFGCNLSILMSSVHINILAFSVEDASLTSVWQLEHHSVWSAQTSGVDRGGMGGPCPPPSGLSKH